MWCFINKFWEEYAQIINMANSSSVIPPPIQSAWERIPINNQSSLTCIISRLPAPLHHPTPHLQPVSTPARGGMQVWTREVVQVYIAIQNYYKVFTFSIDGNTIDWHLHLLKVFLLLLWKWSKLLIRYVFVCLRDVGTYRVLIVVVSERENNECSDLKDVVCECFLCQYMYLHNKTVCKEAQISTAAYKISKKVKHTIISLKAYVVSWL